MPLELSDPPAIVCFRFLCCCFSASCLVVLFPPSLCLRGSFCRGVVVWWVAVCGHPGVPACVALSASCVGVVACGCVVWMWVCCVVLCCVVLCVPFRPCRLWWGSVCRLLLVVLQSVACSSRSLAVSCFWFSSSFACVGHLLLVDSFVEALMWSVFWWDVPPLRRDG
jgi:hypothetical protein